MGSDVTDVLDAAPPDASAARRDKLVFRSALAVAALPFVVTALSMLVTVGGDYRPTGDLAMTEMHIRDIGHHEVLIGLYSSFDWSHPGPMLFYLVAPFYWLTGSASIGLVVGALALNLASIIAILVIARRRGGTPLVVISLLGCLLLARSLGPEFLGDAWNLKLTAFPFALLAFVTWSLWEGELWALPVGVFVTSFLAQTHIGFLALAVPLFAFGLGASAIRLVRARLPDRHGLLRSAAIAAVVFGIVWLPPVLDLVWHSPSNAGNAWRYFRHPGAPGHSLVEGWRVASGQFALAPEWLAGKLPPPLWSSESRYLHHPVMPVGLLALAAAGVVAWRVAREARRLYVIVLVMLATVVVSVMRTAGAVQDYRLFYTWVPPMLAAVVVAWVVWLALARYPAARRALSGAALAGAVAVAGVLAVSGATQGTPHADDAKVVDQLTAPLLERYADSDEPLVIHEDFGFLGPWYTRGVALQLERYGIPVEIDPGMGYQFARSQIYDGGPVSAHLVIATDNGVEPLLERQDLQLVARWLAVPLEEHNRLNREAEKLLADREAGVLSEDEYLFFLDVIGTEKAGEKPETAANDVAVFIDERSIDERES